MIKKYAYDHTVCKTQLRIRSGLSAFPSCISPITLCILELMLTKLGGLSRERQPSGITCV